VQGGGGDNTEGAQGGGEDNTKRTKGGDITEKAGGEEEEEDPQEEEEEGEGVLTEPTGSAGPRQGSAAWSKDRYIRDDEDQAI
jgi:hypothetical protein